MEDEFQMLASEEQMQMKCRKREIEQQCRFEDLCHEQEKELVREDHETMESQTLDVM